MIISILDYWKRCDSMAELQQLSSIIYGCDISQHNIDVSDLSTDSEKQAYIKTVIKNSVDNGFYSLPNAVVGGETINGCVASEKPISFILLRAGHGNSKDAIFEYAYNAIVELNNDSYNIGIGAWWFATNGKVSYFNTYKSEYGDPQITKFKEALHGKKFDYPIYLDFENEGYGGTLTSNIASCSYASDVPQYWIEKLEEDGWYAGVYTSASVFAEKLDDNSYVRSKPIWIAGYYSDGENSDPAVHYGSWFNNPYPWQITQYWGNDVSNTQNNRLYYVDRDKCNVDYPSYIKAIGKNGYTATDTSNPDPDPEPTPIEPLNIPRKKLKLYIAHSTPAVTTLKDKTPLSIDRLEYDGTEWNGSLTKKETTDDDDTSSSDPSSQTGGGD